MRRPVILWLAAALVLSPLRARGADLVIWWDKGFVEGEDQAIVEVVAAFEQATGKHVELALFFPNEMPEKAPAAIEAGNSPDVVTSVPLYLPQWANEGRLVDLSDALGPLASAFNKDALERVTLFDASTGRRGLYGLPIAISNYHVHVWRSLLERAGFTLADLPKDWEGFWSYWCDRVQPAIRKATGREDIYAVGLPMSAGVDNDTEDGFRQFMEAYEADYVTREGRIIIDEPSVRDRLIRALDSYTAIYRKGCTPPDSIDWDNYGNNKAFLDQNSVVTLNGSLSIPNALKATRPQDYYKNTVTIDWPSGAYGQSLPVVFDMDLAAVLKAGGHVDLAKQFMHFLVAEGWLAHWLDFTGDRYLPPMPALLETPFWLDPGDHHHMVSAMQFLTLPHTYDYAQVSGDWRHSRVATEAVWSTAVHRVAVDGLTPEQAVDEAIARIKQILNE